VEVVYILLAIKPRLRHLLPEAILDLTEELHEEGLHQTEAVLLHLLQTILQIVLCIQLNHRPLEAILHRIEELHEEGLHQTEAVLLRL
jgi:hypothetical protein